MKIFLWAKDKVQNAIAYIAKGYDNYYKFGEDDRLPNRIIDTVNDSGTARACIGKLSKFIAGSGFKDTALGNANPLQSFNSLLGDFSINTSYLENVCFRVLYANDGTVDRIYAVPSQLIRRIGRNAFRYNDLMGYPGYVRSQDRLLQAYNPKETPQSRQARVQKQIDMYSEQFGDIVYHFKKGLGLYQDIYSVPAYYSGIDDLESDAGIARIEKRNIQRGWRTQIIISTGPMDHNTADEKGKTPYDKFADTITKFTGDEAAAVLHLEGATNEAKPTVSTINVAEILDSTEKATDRVGRKVCRHMGVPPILVGFETAGKLGDTEELQNTMELFKLSVVEYQKLIGDALKIVFPDKDFEILPISLWAKPATPAPATTQPAIPTP